MKALMDLTSRSFHFRQCLDVCISEIARLDSYEQSATPKRDTPLKIRQDLLAVNDAIELALYMRRFAEITNSVARTKSTQIVSNELTFEGGKASVKAGNISLYKFLSRLIHSNTSAVSRNIVHLFLHFDAQAIPKSLLEPPLDRRAAVILDTREDPKRFFWLREVLDVSLKFVLSICDKDDDTREYVNRRPV